MHDVGHTFMLLELCPQRSTASGRSVDRGVGHFDGLLLECNRKSSFPRVKRVIILVALQEEICLKRSVGEFFWNENRWMKRQVAHKVRRFQSVSWQKGSL